MAVGRTGLAVTLTLTLTLAVGTEPTAMAIRIAVATRGAVLPTVAAVAGSVAVPTAASELLRPAHIPLVHREFRNDPGHRGLALDPRKRCANQAPVQRPSFVNDWLGSRSDFDGRGGG